MKLIAQNHLKGRFREHARKGVFFVLAVICLMGAMTFVGMSVDLGMITVTKTRMQSAADAAALAAAQEIVVAVREASWDAGTGLNMDAVQAAAAADAREMAEYVAQINGFYIDPDDDVDLGKRILASDGVSYSESWGTGPYNMVRVNIRKDNADKTAPDAKLPLVFAPVIGTASQSITTSATAFIESRDIVCTLDFSSSMNDDSTLIAASVSRLGKAGVEANLDEIWNTLVASNVTYSNDSTRKKFPSTGYGQINSAIGTYNSSNTSSTVIQNLGIYTPENRYYYSWSFNSSGDDYYFTTSGGFNWRRFTQGTFAGQLRRKTTTGTTWTTVAETTAPGYFPTVPESCIPWPQEGKNTTTGMRLGRPSISTSYSLWIAYIDYVRTNSDLNTQGYNKRYGYRTLVQYMLANRPSVYQSEDLWRTPHYPFHAMKMGMETFCEFMTDLSYGDNIGMVDYAVDARIETGLNEDGVPTVIDLAGDELTTRYMDINTISMHKQAGHYSSNTATGAGIAKAIELISEEGRYGAQKAILLMTDGIPNVSPGGFSLPSDWDWNKLFDYDGNGVADYTTTNTAARYALYQAKLAADQDITIHTLCVGAGADTALLKAIAHVSGGYDIVVAPGTSLTALESQLREAFGVLAGQVPPARLVVSAEE